MAELDKLENEKKETNIDDDMEYYTDEETQNNENEGIKANVEQQTNEQQTDEETKTNEEKPVSDDIANEVNSKDDEEMEKDSNEESFDLKKEILSWAKIIIGAFIVAYIISNFVIVNARIPSGSMETTINTEDKVVGFRLAYLFSSPERGDIVMFNAPDKEDTVYIKRIIGVPGDEVAIKGGKLFVNGEEMDEPYVNDQPTYAIDPETGMQVASLECKITVPKGQYLMMGDNRLHSNDSRAWGTVEEDEIIAKAVFRYYPSIKNLWE